MSILIEVAWEDPKTCPWADNLRRARETVVETMEEALDRKQKKMPAIFDAVPVGRLLADENMVVTRINDAIRRIVHRDHPQIIDRQMLPAERECLGAAPVECGPTRRPGYSWLRIKKG